MPTMKILAAAALATAMAATPVLAKDAQDGTPKHATKVQKKFNKQARMNTRGPRDDMQNGYDRRADYNRGGYDRGGDVFWPGRVAEDIAGAAIGTAGAIATAPFRDSYYDDSYAYAPGAGYQDSYAYAPRVSYDNDWNNGWNNNGWVGQSYGQRNGFVCTPGSWYTNDYGRTQLCQ